MKGLIEIYIVGASEIICRWILLKFFLKKYLLKIEKILFFGKINKINVGNKDALQSGRKR